MFPTKDDLNLLIDKRYPFKVGALYSPTSSNNRNQPGILISADFGPLYSFKPLVSKDFWNEMRFFSNDIFMFLGESEEYHRWAGDGWAYVYVFWCLRTKSLVSLPNKNFLPIFEMKYKKKDRPQREDPSGKIKLEE